MISKKEFQIVRCSGCALLYTNPRPKADELQVYYQSDEYISHTGSKRNLRERIYHFVRKEMLRRKGRLVDYLIPGKKTVLDVGCGTGAFLKAIQNSDNEVIGYEPADKPRQFAIEKGLEIIGEEKQLESLRNIDMITLWHVLEHMPDFGEKLNMFHKMIKPGGYLILAVPLWQSFDASFYKQYWAAFDLPRHLFHFDNKTIIKACKNAGFDFRQTNALPFDAYYISLLSEKYMKNPLGAIRALIIGTWSGLLAISGRRPWSSQVFVFHKPEE